MGSLPKRVPNFLVVASRFMFIFVIILPFAYSSDSSVAHASPETKIVAEEGSEEVALLMWKASLDNRSQNLLSSWNESSHCSWVGIGCNDATKVTNLNLESIGLRELAYTMEVNEKLDVYSFGVLTLEVVMGRHPGDLISSISSSISLDSSPPSWYGTVLKDILDKRLSLPRNQAEEEAVVLAVKLAVACLHPSPRCRPTMQQVSVALSKQKSHLQNPFVAITLGQLVDSNCPNS